jgi:hypothetical protein
VIAVAALGIAAAPVRATTTAETYGYHAAQSRSDVPSLAESFITFSYDSTANTVQLRSVSAPSRPAARAGARRLPTDKGSTFKGGQYTTRTLKKDLIVRRYYGGERGPIGGFLTRSQYSSPGRAKQYLALPPENTAREVATFRIPAGTTIYEGKVAGVAARGQRGAGNQVYVPKLDPRWRIR